jgi:16S rRNA (cytosine967-C5)-methyltransferase
MMQRRPARSASGRGRSPFRPPSARPRGAPTLARLLALRVLERVERARAHAESTLRVELGRAELSAADRGLAMELVYGTLRWRGRLDHLLAHVLDRGLDKLEPRVVSALRLGAYQLVFAEQVPPLAAIDQTVRCAHAAGAGRAAGLVHTVLRRLAVEHSRVGLPSLEADPLGHLTHALSLPLWLAGRWLDELGSQDAASLARASNEPPPRTVRANRLRTTRDALLALLRVDFPEATACELAANGLVLPGRGDPGRPRPFRDGFYTFEDEASQLVVEWLDPQPGERVLCAGAAPGAQASGIAERVGPEGHVLALDPHPRRVDLLRRDARRLGLERLTCLRGDIARSAPPDTGRPFDRILVSPACTGLGSLRRHPDARWRARPTDPSRLAEGQVAAVENASAALAPGGTLVYAASTLLRAENEAVVEAILRSRADLRLAPEPRSAALAPLLGADGTLKTRPDRHRSGGFGMDGFFAARFVRVAGVA